MDINNKVNMPPETVIARIVGEGAAQYYMVDFTDWKYFYGVVFLWIFEISLVKRGVREK